MRAHKSRHVITPHLRLTYPLGAATPTMTTGADITVPNPCFQIAGIVRVGRLELDGGLPASDRDVPLMTGVNDAPMFVKRC